MDLYIRSQDRLILEKYETLQLCQNPDGTWFFNSGLFLGKYKTKERALEVLDEIQAVIMVNGLLPCELKQELNKRNIDLNDRALFNIKTNKCLYIMPQE